MGDRGRRLLDADEYLADCFRLARRIWEDGFRPDFLIAVWRGGTPPGIVIQEYFRWRGHDPYHTAIRTRILEVPPRVDGHEVGGLEHVIDVVEATHRMLVVDDLFDTGRTVHRVIRYLRRRAGCNAPEVRVATVYRRPRHRRVPVRPDYSLHEVEERPHFPHGFSRLTPREIRASDPELHRILFEPGSAG